MEQENVAKSFSQISSQLYHALIHQCLDASEVKLIKLQIQEAYNGFANMADANVFLNWGLWDKEIYNEFAGFNCNLPALYDAQDVYSQTLLYYLIRPLIKAGFFEKRLLDIGCGNGLGLQASSELLRTEYALGIDLINKFVTNANCNFYIENKINYIQSDAENLPVENESFDIVTNLESSHLYPRIEYFFSEVERVLSSGGFFCYADVHVSNKRQTEKLESFLKFAKNLKVIQRVNISKMVQDSIYRRIIVMEDKVYKNSTSKNDSRLTTYPGLADADGLAFLPWWKIWFKNPALHNIAKRARKQKYWGKKHYFYYLIQKIK